MLMPKKNQIAIYELLFKEGVMVAKKDVHMPKHPELADKNVPNLHVMIAMQSLKSRGYVKEQFGWSTSNGTLLTRAYSISVIISTHLWRLCLPPCAGLGPKDQRVNARQDSQEGRLTETPTEGLLCPLVLTRKPRLGLAQQPPSSSLEEALVMDVVSHHSELEDCCFE
ncbi:40S ribosomal protein S10 [Lemmus lemmus]